MLRDVLLYALIAIPVIILINVLIVSRVSDRVKHYLGLLGVSLAILWILSGALYAFGVGSPAAADQDLQESSSSKWSDASINTASARVENWERDGLVKLEFANNLAFIAPQLWDLVEVQEKKELMISIIVYADSKTERQHKAFAFYNMKSGKQLASWDNISDFNFQY